MSRECERGGCGRPVKAKGLCAVHYDRERQRHRHREDRVLPNRARNRAVARLAKAHPEEFAALLATALEEVTVEHAQLVALAAEHGVEVTEDAQVFRLRRGPAADDETVEDRAVLGEHTCSSCSLTHERGHACPECGTELGMPVERGTSPKRVRVLADELLQRREAETASRLGDLDWESEIRRAR